MRFGLIVFALIGAPSVAMAADALPTSLTWTRFQGAETCISEAELKMKVEGRLGRALSSGVGSGLKIDGKIGRSDSPRGWKASLQVVDSTGQKGERVLVEDSEKCSAIDETLALAILLMVDPDAALRDPNAKKVEAITQPAPPPPLKPAPPPPAEELHVGVRIGGVAGVGILPGLHVAGRVSVFVRLPSNWSIEASAMKWTNARVSEGAMGTDLSLAQYGLALCPTLLGRTQWHLDACAGLELGRLQANGFGLDNPHEDSGWQGYGVVGLGFAWSLAGPLQLHGRVNGVVPFAGRDVQYRDTSGAQRTLYEAAPVGLWEEIGLGLQF